MRRLQPYLKLIASALLVALPAELLMPGIVLARQGEQSVVQNVRASRQGPQVTILYSLGGEAGRAYTVTLTLKREQDQNFTYSPKKVAGDVGEDVTAGTDKRMVWDLSDEYPTGLAGNDFYFVVEAVGQKIGGGISPLVWIGGAAAVGGAAALLLLSKKSSGSGGTTPPPTSAEFPAEPGRPR